MKKMDYETTTGNIFADLGIDKPEEHLAKVKLARQISALIEKKGLTQKEAAQLLDIDQPKISALTTGKLSGFSLERLFRFLIILGQDITIKVTQKKETKKTPHISVTLQKIKRQPLPDKAASRPALVAKKKNK